MNDETTITNAECLDLMNFFGPRHIREMREKGLLSKFNIPSVVCLPRSKYKEALQYLKSGAWKQQ